MMFVSVCVRDEGEEEKRKGSGSGGHQGTLSATGGNHSLSPPCPKWLSQRFNL